MLVSIRARDAITLVSPLIKDGRPKDRSMNKKCNRRDFIKSASLLPVTAGLGLGTGSAAALQPIKRAGGSALKVSCNAYSFAKLLNSQLQERGPGISLFDLAEFCAKQNFDGVDLTGYYFPGYEK